MRKALAHLGILALAAGSFPLVQRQVRSAFPQLFETDCGGDLLVTGSYFSAGICLVIFLLLNLLFLLGRRTLGKP